jgi:hypothetical protein
LQPAQDEDEQPPQPALPPELPAEDPSEDFPIPKRDKSLLVFEDPHLSQEISAVDPKTSFSKSAPQLLQ